MIKEKFKQSVSLLLEHSNPCLSEGLLQITQLFKVLQVDYKENLKEYAQFLFCAIIDHVIIQDPALDNKKLIVFVKQLLTIMECDTQVLSDFNHAFHEIESSLIHSDQLNIPAYFGFNHCIVGNQSFNMLFNCSHMRNYEDYIRKGYGKKTRKEMLALNDSKLSVFQNCYKIPLKNSIGIITTNQKNNAKTIYPEWHVKKILDRGHISTLFFVGQVIDRTAEIVLNKTRDKITKKSHHFISTILSRAKHNPEYLKQAIIISTLQAKTLEGVQISNVNLIKTFAILVELGQVCFKKILNTKLILMSGCSKPKIWNQWLPFLI